MGRRRARGGGKSQVKVCLFIVVGVVVVVRVVAHAGVIITRGYIIHERAPIPVIMRSMPRAIVVGDIGVAIVVERTTIS